VEKIAFGTKLWLLLVGLILGGDVFALWTGRETFTEALGRALEHPRRRWLVILSWTIVTKHLFLNEHFKYLDPIGVMAIGVKLIKR